MAAWPIKFTESSYASCVWQIGNKDNLDRSNTVQRKGSSIILGLPSTASLEAMEVMSGVIPLDFRREETAIRDIGKINSYSTKIPFKNQLDKWRRKETTDRHISPLGLMCLQGEEMKKETKIDHIEELEAPRSLYSSPGYNNNISQ